MQVVKRLFGLAALTLMINSAVFPQSTPGHGNATAQLTISLTVVSSVSVSMPEGRQPEIIVVNAADNVRNFGNLEGITYQFPADQHIEKSQQTRPIRNKSGRNAILITTTVVVK